VDSLLGKLEKKGTRVCEKCRESRIEGFCEWCGVLMIEEDLQRCRHLLLGYLKKPIVFHPGGFFTYLSGKKVHPKRLKKFAKADPLIVYLSENGFPNEELLAGVPCVNRIYHVDKEAREKILHLISQKP